MSLGVVIAVWGNSINWKIASITAYQWFPLFGMLAWITMAGHYYTGTLRLLNPSLQRALYYKPASEYLVLAAILLHPGLLITKLYQDGLGTPPMSYLDYVGKGMEIAVLLGTFSFFVFLSYEIFSHMKSKPLIQRYWWLISISQSIAMTFIWIHALRLGSNLGEGWFKLLWIIMGLALIPCFYFIHRDDFTPKDSTKA